LVPIGLPGMGKTTLSKSLKKDIKKGPKVFTTDSKLEFFNIAYDKIYTKNKNNYLEDHPDASENEVA